MPPSNVRLEKKVHAALVRVSTENVKSLDEVMTAARKISTQHLRAKDKDDEDEDEDESSADNATNSASVKAASTPKAGTAKKPRARSDEGEFHCGHTGCTQRFVHSTSRTRHWKNKHNGEIPETTN